MSASPPATASSGRRAFAVLGFPLLVLVTHAVALLLMARGVEVGAAIVPSILLAYLVLAIGERVCPLHERWNRRHGDLRTDVALFVTNGGVNQLLAPFLLGGAAAAAAWLSQQLGSHLWPAFPLWLGFPLALVVAELWEYSCHRAMHEVPWLWRLHATHHSAPRLYWLNSARFHPVDLLLVGLGKAVPLVVLGVGAETIALVTLFSAVHGAYQHANVPVRLGVLNWVFSMSELHRWHHSPHVEEANHNYGGNLILWDVVFGTRFLPADREPPVEIGIADMPHFPKGFWANLAAPFRWEALRTAAAPRAADPD